MNLEKVSNTRTTKTYRYGSWVITTGTMLGGQEVWVGKLGNAMSFRVEGTREDCLAKLKSIGTH